MAFVILQADYHLETTGSIDSTLILSLKGLFDIGFLLGILNTTGKMEMALLRNLNTARFVAKMSSNSYCGLSCDCSDTLSSCGSRCSLPISVQSENTEASLPAPTRSVETWSFPSERNHAKKRGKVPLRCFRKQMEHGLAHSAVASSNSPQNNAMINQLKMPNSVCSITSRHQRFERSKVSESLGQSCSTSECSTQSGLDGLSKSTASRPIAGSCDDVTMLGLSFMNTPTIVEYKQLRCMILDAPNNGNLNAYIAEMAAFGVTDLVRTCIKTYDEGSLHQAGINVHELIFPDGEGPSPQILKEWLTIVRNACSGEGAVAVHCVAGLGRAPVLAALALVEEGMTPDMAVASIRGKRKGAINRRQLQFVASYKKQVRVAESRCLSTCAIM